MTALTEVFVTVKPDMDKFGPEVKKKLNSIDAKNEGKQVATRFGVGMNGAMGSIVSKSAGIFAAGFAAVQGAKVFGGFIKEAAESEKISRITANAIRATGGAAKISADQVSALATSISNKTAIDDEQVQSAANMLLTFKNIRNETGKGNDVFNQATQAAADLSVQFGGIDGASKQLGKALNDPIKGTTALAKAGVTFTDQQKEQIKTLVKSGDTLGAQKIILAEIQGQVGGAAAAAADPMERLKVVAGNLGEQIGGFLLPAVNKFAGFATATLIPGIQALFAAFQEGDVTSDGFVGFMERVGVAARTAFDFFKAEVLPRLKEFAGFVVGTVVPAVAGFVTKLVTELTPAVKGTFGFFKDEVLPRLQEFASFLSEKVLPPIGQFAEKVLASKDFLVPFAAVILTVITAMKAWAIVQGVLNVVMSANPIGLVVIAIAGLVAGIIYAYKHSETFRNILQGAFQGIQKAAQTFAPLVKAAIDVVIAVFNLWWNYYAKPILKMFGTALTTAWGLATKFGTVVVAGFNAIKEPARAALAFVIGRFLGFVGDILTGAAKAFGWVPELGGKLKTAATEFGKFRDSVNAKLDGINDEPVDIKVGLAYTQALGQKTKQMKFADGGMMPGYTPGRDVHRFYSATGGILDLSGGEPVLRPEAGSVLGKGWVDGINGAARTGGKGGVQRFLGGFASGGLIPRAMIPSARRLGLLTNAAAAGVDTAGTAVAQAIAKQLVKMQSNPGLAGVLNFVKSQVGKPYLWGGVGPRGYDCSGLVSAAINTAFGRNPYSRLGATGSMPWKMFASGPGAFEVGWFKGNPGHTAATVNGTNIESRGGRGVVMGRAARGARDRLFTNRAHVKGFAGGGIYGDAPYDTLHDKKRLMKELGIDLFDKGGRWKSGTLAANMSGHTETVIPGDGAMELSDRSIERLAERLADAIAKRPTMLDGRLISDGFARRALNY